MISKRSLIVLVLAAVVVGGLWYWLRPTPEKAVRKRLAALADCVSRQEQESVPGMAFKMTSLSGLFAPQVTIVISGFPGESTYTAEELASEIARFRPGFSRIDLTFYDVEVEVQDKQNASIACTARLVLNTAPSGSTQETRVLHCRLTRTDGPWQFAAFSEQPILRR